MKGFRDRPRLLVLAALLAGLAMLAGTWLLRGDRAPSEETLSAEREAARTDPARSPLLASAAPRPSGLSPASTGESSVPSEEADTGGEAPEPAPVRVVLDLRLPDGSQPDHASVHHGEVGQDTYSRPWTPDASEVELPSGRVRLTVRAGRFGEWRVEDFEIDATPGARVRVDLRPRPMIVGRVAPAEGDDQPESDVQATLVHPRTPDAADDDERAVEPMLVRASEEGWFAFGVDEALAAGRYEVSANAWRGGPARATTRVTVDTEPVSVVLQLPPVDPAEGVTIRVFDADGAVVSPKFVTLDLQDDTGGGRSGGCTFHRRSDGSLWIPTALSLDPGRRWTEAVLWIFTDLGVKPVRLPRVLGNEEIRVRLDRPSDVTVELDGRPPWLREATVRLIAKHPFSPGTRTGMATAKADLEGAHLGAVQPGTYVLMLSAQVDGWDVGLDLGDVEVRSGPQRIVHRLPPLHRTEIHHTGGPLSLFRVGRPWEHAQWSSSSREPGSVLAPGLPAGEYELRHREGSTHLSLPATAVSLR
ncbi:MAG TPA: hypothetical protein VND21_11465 [Planctomycetota bacterium]|jgi:hypothetical protein|nr:hypothetical protein [Planctomycetota bacterium]